MIKAVIFDLDDTLISERQYIESGYNYIAKLLSKKLNMNKDLIYERLLILLNDSPNKVFDRLLEYFKVAYTRDTILDLVKEYHNHVPTINFYDDVIPVITTIKQAGIKLGIISDGYVTTQTNKLNVLNAQKYFDKIILTDTLGKEYWKPNPLAFEMMKDYFGIEFNEMVYVGDNPKKDFYIKKNYPIKTVRVLRKNSIYRDCEYLDGLKEDMQGSDLNLLLDYILQ